MTIATKKNNTSYECFDFFLFYTFRNTHRNLMREFKKCNYSFFQDIRRNAENENLKNSLERAYKSTTFSCFNLLCIRFNFRYFNYNNSCLKTDDNFKKHSVTLSQSKSPVTVNVILSA